MGAETTTSVEQRSETGRLLDASALEAALGYRLRMLEQLVMRSFTRRLDPYDLTPTLYAILILIRDNPGCRQTDLGPDLGMHQPNLVERVGRLVHRGFVARREDPADRRANVLQLTASGGTLIDEVARVHAAHVADVRDLLGPERYDQLVALSALP